MSDDLRWRGPQRARLRAGVPWYARRRQPPPWWPHNEPWPPRSPRAWRRARGRLPGPMRGVFLIGLFFMLVGFTTVLSWLGGVPIARPQRVFGAVIWLFVIAFLFRRVMRMFGGMQTRLQAQDVQRRHLMADIAHELRTPLAVVQGRLEGMLDGIYPRDETQIAAALQETRMLARLVEDLRTLAHTESGTLALQKESTDAGVLVNDSVSLFATDAAGRKVDLDVAVAPDLPLIEVDPLRVREVLVNLISNALRHTPEGGRVTVSASPWEEAIELTVRDTGSGIPAPDLPKIFDRFYKGRSSRGSGLGLTIARNLVVAHGGDIRADSVEGKGTIISVLLPLHPRQS